MSGQATIPDGATAASGEGQRDSVQTQLAQLVPTYDPGVDSVETWSQKIRLLLQAWPEGKLVELATRIVLNTKGSAFQKLQLHQTEIFTGDRKGIETIVSLVGGSFGQVELEKRFEIAEKALFRCVQKPDETADSFLARADVAWTELLAKKMSLAELQAYITLRGSRLTGEDKKRILVESGAEDSGELKMTRVSAAVRMLGSSFFQEYAFGKKDKSLKTYDNTAFVAEECDDQHDDGSRFGEDWYEDEIDPSLHDDEDAALIVQFENAVVDSVQEDRELSAFFSSYQEARKRLVEKTRSRGFWSSGKGKGSFGKKGFGKQKGKGFRYKSLAQRIAESACRRCGATGHWKAECPLNQASSSDGKNVVPTSVVIDHEAAAVAVVEPNDDTGIASFLDDMEPWHDPTETRNNMEWCFGVISGMSRGNRFTEGLKYKLSGVMSNTPRKLSPTSKLRESRPTLVKPICQVDASAECHSLFCSTGTTGVVDLGASQSVIGSDQLKELLEQLQPQIRSQLKRQQVDLIFRFGNHQTLQSKVAVHFPLHGQWFRVAVVPGKTPFLLSSNFLQTIQAVIDASECTLWSKVLKRYIPVYHNEKNLMMMNINDLWGKTQESTICQAEAQTPMAGRPTSSGDEFSMKGAPDCLVNGKNESELQQLEADVRSSCQAHITKVEGKQVHEKQCQPHRQQGSESEPAQPSASERSSAASGSSNVSPCAIPCKPRRHGLAQAVPSLPGKEPGGGYREDSFGHIGRDKDRFWQGQGQSDICSGLSRQGLDQLHADSFRGQREAVSSPFLPVCQIDDPRGFPDLDKECQDQRVQQEKGGESSNQSQHGQTSGRGGGFRVGANVRDQVKPNRDGEPNGACGRSSGTGDLTPSAAVDTRTSDSAKDRVIGQFSLAAESMIASQNDGKGCEEIPIELMDFEFASSTNEVPTFHKECQRLIQSLRKELSSVQQIIKPTGKKMKLYEIMCGSESELTKQCHNLGMQARRFGMFSGDLSTPSGRRKLFAYLCAEQPEHVWYSPECGPWCRWSAMNMSRSLEALQKVLDDRRQRLWQVALGVVLCEHQVAMTKHFHLEQPDGSAMLKLPCLGPLLSVAHPSVFDLCRVGKLQEPVTGMPIRKRLQVCTTSVELKQNLDGQKCQGLHEHYQIAGSTQVNHQSMSVSKFTENYPRKFARQVCQILQKRNHLHPNEVLANEVSEFGPEDHPTKRRRLGQKSSPMQIVLRHPNVQWLDVMKAVDVAAPRVGVVVWEQGEILEAVRTLCPNHVVRHVVVCRGTDRMLGPNTRLIPGEAPWRRMICIRRRFEDVVVEPEWENWERLSYRQLRRKSTAARCNITIFARPKYESWPEASDVAKNDAQNEQSAVKGASHKRAGEGSSVAEDENRLKRSRGNPLASEAVLPISERLETGTDAGEKLDRIVVDLTCQKHGPKFLELSPEEQQWLLKLHRNMGHPGHQKLTYMCKQLNCDERILKAVPDIKCSTCQESQTPTIPRPSAIKEPLDFGDIVAMDGITWTNAQGAQFHFYHMIDHSTAFQSAYCAPSRTAGDALRALTIGWMLWAGPPGQLILDAAGEFCDDTIQDFSQKHGIKLRIIPPEAHWQNSRCERHGGILQQILTKMDLEDPITSYDQLEQALVYATQTKNQWSRHRGYPPEVLVFGKLQRQPGSVVSDDTCSAHELARTDSPEGIRFRAELSRREHARQAFVKVDNDQACRRALLQRTRPNRGRYQPGDWIMLWRDNKRWIGPMRVIQQEGNTCVWAVFGNRLYRGAPEQVRPLSAVEEVSLEKTWSNPKEEKPIGRPELNESFGDMPAPTQGANPEVLSQPGSRRDSTEPEPSIGSPSIVNTEDLEENIQHENDHIEIPVPDDDDDELVCEALQVNSDQCWSMQIELDVNEISKMCQTDGEEQVALLVSAAKKQRSEIKLKDLSNEDRKLFDAAKNKELQSWLDTGTIQRICRQQIPKENVLRCRWLLTWKDMGEINKTTKTPKARLIVLGYEDPQLCELDRDSPTLSKLARMLILQFAASSGWDIGSFDIRTAFLRGSDDSRQLGLEPPPELRTKMKLADHEIVQLLEGAYGRVDAPLLWFREFQKGLLELQFTQSPFDPCLFTLQDKKGKTCGLIGIHVDDGLCCGTPEFHAKLKLLEEKYPFGSRKTRDFIFTGLHIQQHQDYSITVDQSKYVKAIEPIHVQPQRRHDPQQPVTEDERQQLRGLIGSLQYASTNSRPDLGSRLSFLQSQINHAVVQTLMDGNRTLQEAKRHADTALRIQPIPLHEIRFVSFSDAAFASNKNHSSHKGMLLMTAHKSIGENQSSPVNPILWSSRKIQKVAVSTLSAEAMALASAVDTLAWARLFWAWLVDNSCQWQLGDQTLLRLPPAFTALKDEDDSDEPNESLMRTHEISKKMSLAESIISTDCKSLYDIISRTAQPACSEFRTLLQAKLIREHLATGVMIRWVPTGAQMADSLTKIMDSTVLRECLRLGHYRLQDEAQVLKTRADAKTRIRWLRGTESNSKSSEKSQVVSETDAFQ